MSIDSIRTEINLNVQTVIDIIIIIIILERRQREGETCLPLYSDSGICDILSETPPAQYPELLVQPGSPQTHRWRADVLCWCDDVVVRLPVLRKPFYSFMILFGKVFPLRHHPNDMLGRIYVLRNRITLFEKLLLSSQGNKQYWVPVS